jgi:uncharacterized protein (UPF0332 family)
LATARILVEIDPDRSASCSYYAAFYAVTALFSTTGDTFGKHTAVRSAVHRDLVRTGTLSTERGRDFDDLFNLRILGDYGGAQHVSIAKANQAFDAAEHILDDIRSLSPGEFR